MNGNHFGGSSDYRVRELTVDADAVMIYSVGAWERAAAPGATVEDMVTYWSTGITLTDWISQGAQHASEWELLLNDESILSFAIVADSDILSAAPKSALYNVSEALYQAKRQSVRAA